MCSGLGAVQILRIWSVVSSSCLSFSFPVLSRPQDGPFRPQDGPRWPKDGELSGDKRPQDGSKMAPTGPKRASAWPLGTSKSVLSPRRRANYADLVRLFLFLPAHIFPCPFEAPKWSFLAPRWPKMAQGWRNNRRQTVSKGR